MIVRSIIYAALPFCVAMGFAETNAVTASEFSAQIEPFLAENCFSCHGEKKQKGDIRLDTLSRDLSDPAAAITWSDVLDMLTSGEMPPEDVEERPLKAAAEAFAAAVKTQLHLHAKSQNPADRPQIRRLSHTAMDNTVRDLTGVDLPLSTGLPHDPEVGGFDNIAETMTISQEVMAQLQFNAHKVANFALTDQKNPRLEASFAKKTLLGGVRVMNIGDYKAAFSNKNIGYVIEPSDFVAPFPGYYQVEVVAFAYDNRDLFAPKGETIALVKKSDKSNLSPRIPAEQPRFAQIRVPDRTADGKMLPATGAFPPPSRTAGEIKLTDKPTPHTVRVWLNANDTVTIYYGSGRRLTTVPMAMLKGKEQPIGEALYVQSIKVSGPELPSWPLPLEQLRKDTRDPDTLIKTLLSQTFRRPADAETVSLYRALYDERLKQNPDTRDALHQVLEAALCSPRFLFNYDDGLSNRAWALACRLSYFLWNSMPDAELFKLAASGELLNPDIIAKQAQRLLADDRSDRFVAEFSGQWLSTRRVGRMIPDQKLFPKYDKNLEEAFKAEPAAFFREVLKQNLSIDNFIDSNFVMVNDRLAEHYQIPGIKGPEFRSVALHEKSPRGGVLAQAALLTATSDGTRTSPVIRGIWVLENILGGSISPPPANVKPLEPDVRGALSIREMLEKHRKVESCNDCHRKIDPLGFALENFDPIGTWRDTYTLGKPKKGEKTETITASKINTEGQLPDGTKIEDFVSLKAALLKKHDQFAKTLTGKLFTHAMGRLPTIAEKHILETVLVDAKRNHYRFADLIVALCQSEPFTGAPPGAATHVVADLGKQVGNN